MAKLWISAARALPEDITTENTVRATATTSARRQQLGLPRRDNIGCATDGVLVLHDGDLFFQIPPPKRYCNTCYFKLLVYGAFISMI